MRAELDHVGIAVTSLSESARQYEALGLTLAAAEEVAEQGVAVIRASGGSGGEVELLEATKQDSAIARFLERAGPGLHHLAFRVDNLEEAIARYTEAGFEVIGSPGRGAGGCRCVFLHPRSCGGVLLEVLQRETEKERV